MDTSPKKRKWNDIEIVYEPGKACELSFNLRPIEYAFDVNVGSVPSILFSLDGAYFDESFIDSPRPEVEFPDFAEFVYDGSFGGTNKGRYYIKNDEIDDSEQSKTLTIIVRPAKGESEYINTNFPEDSEVQWERISGSSYVAKSVFLENGAYGVTERCVLEIYDTYVERRDAYDSTVDESVSYGMMSTPLWFHSLKNSDGLGVFVDTVEHVGILVSDPPGFDGVVNEIPDYYWVQSISNDPDHDWTEVEAEFEIYVKWVFDYGKVVRFDNDPFYYFEEDFVEGTGEVMVGPTSYATHGSLVMVNENYVKKISDEGGEAYRFSTNEEVTILLTPNEHCVTVGLLGSDGTRIIKQGSEIRHTFNITEDVSFVGVCGIVDIPMPGGDISQSGFMDDEQGVFEEDVSMSWSSDDESAPDGFISKEGSVVCHKITPKKGRALGLIPPWDSQWSYPEPYLSYYSFIIDRGVVNIDNAWFYEKENIGKVTNFVPVLDGLTQLKGGNFVSTEDTFRYRLQHVWRHYPYHRSVQRNYDLSMKRGPSGGILHKEYGSWADRNSLAPKGVSSGIYGFRRAHPVLHTKRPILKVVFDPQTYKDASLDFMASGSTPVLPITDEPNTFFTGVRGDSRLISSEPNNNDGRTLFLYAIAAEDESGAIQQNTLLKGQCQTAGWASLVAVEVDFTGIERDDNENTYLVKLALWPWPRTTNELLASSDKDGAIIEGKDAPMAEYCDVPVDITDDMDYKIVKVKPTLVNKESE